MPRLPSVANQDGGILTYFDDPWKIEDLTKSKKFCGKLLQKISCIILVKNIFGVRCTLIVSRSAINQANVNYRLVSFRITTRANKIT